DYKIFKCAFLKELRILPIIFGGSYMLFIGDGITQEGDSFSFPLTLLYVCRCFWLICYCHTGTCLGAQE
ncbi:hypothetical protein, partial [Phocaeicola coprocola]|uniref:hypothetical protein n=1 Tax=Phocaeicola coprocola TaxID=310298 RepID=UPI004027CD9C